MFSVHPLNKVLQTFIWVPSTISQTNDTTRKTLLAFGCCIEVHHQTIIHQLFYTGGLNKLEVIDSMNPMRTSD